MFTFVFDDKLNDSMSCLVYSHYVLNNHVESVIRNFKIKTILSLLYETFIDNYKFGKFS